MWKKVVDSTLMEKTWRNEPMIRTDLPLKKRRTPQHLQKYKQKACETRYDPLSTSDPYMWKKTHHHEATNFPQQKQVTFHR